MIRRATTEDIPAILQMGLAMIEESRFAEFGPDPKAIVESLEQIIDHDDVVVFVADGGFFIGRAYNFWWNPLYRQAQDVAMYVAPDKRGTGLAGKLVEAFKDWAAENADDTVIGSSTGVNKEAWARMAERAGFEVIGLVARA